MSTNINTEWKGQADMIVTNGRISTQDKRESFAILCRH
jgi:hypothetical protein